jgi:hypothetical protein
MGASAVILQQGEPPGYVDASPSVYLYRYGPILKDAISW